MTTAAPPPLTFDEAAHEYRVGGRRLPSVTEIIRTVKGLIDDRWFNEEARARGTALHAAIHYHNEDALDLDTLDPRVRPYFMAYLKFVGETGFEPLHCEEHMAHPEYHYAGTFDCIGILNGAAGLPDFKSGGWSPWMDLQLAAYEELALANIEKTALAARDFPLQKFVVELRADATYRLHPMKLNRDHARGYFLSALHLHKFASKGR